MHSYSGPPPSNNNHQDYYIFSRGISIHLHLPLLLVHAQFIHIFTSISYVLSTKKQEKHKPPPRPYCWWFRNPAPVELGSLWSHYYLQGLFYTSKRWWNALEFLNLPSTPFLVPIMRFPQDTVYLAPRSCCSLSPLVNKKYPPDAVERSRRGHRNVSGDPGWAWNLQCSNLVGAVALRFPRGGSNPGVPGPQIKHGAKGSPVDFLLGRFSNRLINKNSSWKLWTSCNQNTQIANCQHFKSWRIWWH